MTYSDIYLRNKSKPSVVLVILAVVAIGGFLFTFFNPGARSTRASKLVLLDHSVVNLSSRQAGIYYQTDAKTASWIMYGTNPGKLDTAAFDDRDTADKKSQTYLHYVPLRDLQENTTYYYSIIAEDEVIKVNEATTFSFRTISAVGANSSVAPAYGKVIKKNNEPVDNGFVLYYFPGAYPLLAEIKSGDWLIPLNLIIDKTTGKALFPTNDAKVKIMMIDEDKESTTIQTSLQNTTPLQKTAIIGEVYTPPSEENVLPATTSIAPVSPTAPVVARTVISSVPTAVPTPFPTASTLPLSPIEITFPKEGALIPGTNPLIKGLAIPDQNVGIALTRNQKEFVFSTNVNSTSQGDWKVSLPMPLSAATYQLSMSTKDSTGKLITLKRTFSIAKNGETVLGVATGEATIAPTEVPTATPVLALQPSPTSTTYVTPTVVTSPPVTGFDSGSLMFGGLALVIISAGILLIL